MLRLASKEYSWGGPPGLEVEGREEEGREGRSSGMERQGGEREMEAKGRRRRQNPAGLEVVQQESETHLDFR